MSHYLLKRASSFVYFLHICPETGSSRKWPVTGDYQIVTSFQKSVSGALEIQLHETKDCFLSYKCNEMRIRVEWSMAGSPSLPAEFYPVCMMPSGRLLTTSPVIF